jgi:hypothetical protein
LSPHHPRRSSCVAHQSGLEGTGADAIAHAKAATADVHGVFPVLRFDVEDSALSGDILGARFRGTGQDMGPFFGAPSGRALSFVAMECNGPRRFRGHDHAARLWANVSRWGSTTRTDARVASLISV